MVYAAFLLYLTTRGIETNMTNSKGNVGRSGWIARFCDTAFIRAGLALGLLATLIVPALASADTPISQGYLSNEHLALGSIVSLDKNTSDHVTAATTNNASNMLGVIVDAGNSLLALANGQASQVQVATNGVVQVLVSNINGPINAGDQITASPLSGVGMKATTNAEIIGTAQNQLSTGSGNTETYTDKQGQKHTVFVGSVPLLVNVSYFYRQPDKTLIPSALQNIANAFAGKTVSTLPILLSVAIFIVTLIVVVSIVYSMIRSSIISVGRNPMSQSAIYRDLVQLSALVIGILGVAVVSIYLILTRL